MALEVVAITPNLERLVRKALDSVPDFVIKAARIARVESSTREDVVQQLAMFEHGSRKLFISPKIPTGIAVKAVIHEMGHAIDDNPQHPHYYSSSDAWGVIHRDQPYFDIPKYGAEPLEYFADCFAKYFVMSREANMIARPKETQYIELVLQDLEQRFGGK
jgi:hypothetical protein